MEQIVEPISPRKELTTPRAAAVAGIIFAILFAAGLILIWLWIPDNLTSDTASPTLTPGVDTTIITIALSLIPFAGIAFLWFLGVMRDVLGSLEDRFFATVFFGSGLLFLGMVFATAAVSDGIILALNSEPDRLIGSEGFDLGRAILLSIMNIYAVRMAGVFMLSLNTIWLRTHLMPRWLIWLTFGLAFVLLVGIDARAWLIMVFPVWVLLISIYVLIRGPGNQ